MEQSVAVWWWSDPSCQWLSKVLDHIKTSNGLDKDQAFHITMMHCEDVSEFEKSVPLTNYFFDLYLTMNSIKEDKIMFLNLKDLISSVELYLAIQRKKDDCADIDVQNDEILKFYNKYVISYENEDSEDKSIVAFKEFLKTNNCVDVNALHNFYQKCNQGICNYVDVHTYLILGTPSSPLLKQFISTLSVEKVFSISMEIPLDISLHGTPNSQTLENVKITDELIDRKDVAVNYKSSEFGSATEEYVEDLFLSFLSLLVNNRNELALSKVMISPVINFSHQAFTALKHLSVEKEMPMCQVALSYVTRLRLGGKGYAPPGDCPMLPHLKGLELFVDTLNQLQTVIEEASSPQLAIKRLINILKKKLLKSGSEKLKNDSIEKVAEKLKVTVLSVSEILNSRISTNGTQICQGTLDVLYHFINYINCDYFIFDPEVILSKQKAKRTPLNLPPLLGYFRSPDEESSCESRLTLNEDSVLSIASVTKGSTSYFHNSESSAGSCIDSSTPSKTTFEDCLKESAEQSLSEKKIKISGIFPDDSHDSVPPKKSRKRSILSEITNEDLSVNDKNTKKDSKKISKVPNKNAKENASLPSGDCLKESAEQSLSEKKIKISRIFPDDSQDSVPPKKSQKRSILNEITNEDLSVNDKSTKKDPKKISKVQNQNAKENSSVPSGKKAKKEPRGPKKFKQIQGQGKITSFFMTK